MTPRAEGRLSHPGTARHVPLLRPFIEGKTLASEMLSNLAKRSQLLSDRAEIQGSSDPKPRLF